MKKSKLLILFPVMGLFLSGCTFQEGLQSTKSWINSHIYQPLKSFFGSSSNPSEEGKKDEEKKEEKKDEGKVFSWEEIEKVYADAGFTGVEIPDYKCASADASLTQPYPEDEPYTYVIKGSSAAEMKAYADLFVSSTWYKQVDDYGDYHFLLGDIPAAGESTPYVYVGDYTAEAAAGIMVAFDIYETPVPSAEFPLSDVNSFLTESSFGFTLSEADAAALSALSTEFTFYGEEGYAHVQFKGEIASEVLAAIDATLVAAEYTYDSEYGAYYDGSFAHAVAAQVEEGSTYLVFMEF